MNAMELPSAAAVEHLLLQWGTAFQPFAAALARYGNAAAALRHFGLAQWEAGSIDRAAEAFAAALALRPRDADLWRDLAGVHDAAARPEWAETCVQTSIGIDAGQASSWLILAGLLDRRGDLDGAAEGYGRATSLEPTLAAAHLGLGIVLFKQQRLDAAAASLRAAVEHEPGNVMAQICLGHVLYREAEFAPSAAAFAAAATLGALDPGSRRNRARALTFQAMIEGRAEEALAGYAELAGEEAEDMELISRDAFSLLSAFGYTEAAASVGRMRLQDSPGDPVRRYLLDAVEGRALTRAPPEYVETYFDRFAPEFDRTLIAVLRYRGPAVMHDLLVRHRSRFAAMLDLGCGTGLAAEHLVRFGGDLTGVDLSKGMLEQAERRGHYRHLVKADAVCYLDQNPGRFDLLFAADLLIYLGDLAPLFRSAARALVPDGLFALSLEATTAADFVLTPSGRFAHAQAYVEALGARDFRVIDVREETIRLEANRPLPGLFMILERRAGPGGAETPAVEASSPGR